MSQAASSANAGEWRSMESAPKDGTAVLASVRASEQGPAEVEQTMGAAREVFTLLREGLDRGRLDALLECDLTQDAFRRLVR